MRSPPNNSSRHPVSVKTNADPANARRIDELAQAIDCCIEARRIAESLGEKFLVYLLAMAIQETRSAMREDIDLRSREP